MHRTHGSLLLVSAAVCSILIPFILRAEERGTKETYVPPSGFAQDRPAKGMKVIIDGRMLESRLIHKVEPVYPAEAKSARLCGKVILSVMVNENGLVSDVKVESGPPILAASAVEAVRQWRYRPFLLGGKPVTVISAVTVVFSFRESGSTVRFMGGRVESDYRTPYGIKIYYTPRILGGKEDAATAVKTKPYNLYHGHKYYTVMLGISPPQLNLNRPKLRALADQGWPGSGIEAGVAVLYRVFISGEGKIAGILRSRGPSIPELEVELAGTQIVAPARLGSDPVPVWMVVEITGP